MVYSLPNKYCIWSTYQTLYSNSMRLIRLVVSHISPENQSSRMDAHKTPCGLRVAPCCRIDTSCCLLLAILNDSWASLLKPVNFYISSMLSWTLLNNECFIYYSTLLASAGPSSSEGWWRLVWRPHGGRRLRKSGTLDLQQCDFGLSIQPNT